MIARFIRRDVTNSAHDMGDLLKTIQKGRRSRAFRSSPHVFALVAK